MYGKLYEKIVVMTHFPPFNYRLEDNEMTDLFKAYGVSAVVYGHLHKDGTKQRLTITKDNINYYLTSCDMVDNTLIEIK